MSGQRALDQGVLIAINGRPLANARAVLYETDGTTPLTGAYTGPTGGVAVTSIVTDARGRWEVWAAEARRYQRQWTDNTGTAYYADQSSSAHRSFASFFQQGEFKYPTDVDAEQPFWNLADNSGVEADPTGAADSAAAFVAANLLTTFDKLVPAGTYKLSSALTLDGRWRFAKGAKLKPDAGTNAVQTLSLGGATTGTFTLSYGGYTTVPLPPTNEVQRIKYNAVTAGTYTLTLNGETTTPLPYNADGTDMQTALRALPSIAGADVVRVPDSPEYSQNAQWDITFVNAMGVTDIAQITADDSLLTGTITMSTVTAGIPNPATLTTTQLRQALDDLPSLPFFPIAITGSTGGPFTITFSGGELTQTPIADLAVTNSTNGTPTCVTATAGVSKALTFNGDLDAGLEQVFDLTGSGRCKLGSACRNDEIYPQWWGAVLDSATDDIGALVAAARGAIANGGTLTITGPLKIGALNTSTNINVNGSLEATCRGAKAKIVGSSPSESTAVDLFELGPTTTRLVLSGMVVENTGTVIGDKTGNEFVDYEIDELTVEGCTFRNVSSVLRQTALGYVEKGINRFRFQNNRVDGYLRGCVALTTALLRSSVVTGNDVRNGVGVAFRLGQGNSEFDPEGRRGDHVVTGNHFHNLIGGPGFEPNAVKIVGSRRAVISDNIVDGIIGSSHNGYADSEAIYVSARWVTVTGNTIIDVASALANGYIAVKGGAEECMVLDNQLIATRGSMGAMGDGIRVEAASLEYRAVPSTAYPLSTRVIVRGNKLRGFIGGAGIDVGVGGGELVTIEDNELLDWAGYAIVTSNVSKLSVRRNKVRRNAVNAQTIYRFSGTVTGGTFTVTFNGQTTAPIAWNASADTFRAALEALSNVRSLAEAQAVDALATTGDVVVTSERTPTETLTTPLWVVDLVGQYFDVVQPVVTINSAGLLGTAPVYGALSPAIAIYVTPSGSSPLADIYIEDNEVTRFRTPTGVTGDAATAIYVAGSNVITRGGIRNNTLADGQNGVRVVAATHAKFRVGDNKFTDVDTHYISNAATYTGLRVVTAAADTVDPDFDDVVIYDTTANAVAVTLKDGHVGQEVTIKRQTGGANAVTIDPAGATTIDGAATLVLSVVRSVRLVYVAAGKWENIDSEFDPAGHAAQFDLYTSTPGAAIVPPVWAGEVCMIAQAPGAGGGSGRKVLSGTAGFGGGGGSGGARTVHVYKVSELSATFLVNVGAGGAGGVSQATNSQNGNPGSAPASSTSVTSLDGTQTYARPSNGAPGGGGTTAAGTAGAAVVGQDSGGVGGAAGAAGGAGGAGGVAAGGASGGGAGGGIAAAGPTASAGGTGGLLGQVTSGGNAGGAIGADGTDATASITTSSPLPGRGGGGGGSSITGNGGTGGDGVYGGGGGGGGAALDGVGGSGAGGRGGDGYVALIWRA